MNCLTFNIALIYDEKLMLERERHILKNNSASDFIMNCEI